jgi:RNA polymerase sigma factor (TIGR02999 family)
MDDASARRGAVTDVLLATDTDGAGVVERVWPLLYDDLRDIARRYLRRESPGHTLVTTALVHEAFLKLVDGGRVEARGRAYFFGAAARAMRQVLVDHARRGQRLKRQAGEDAEASLPKLAAGDVAVDILDLHEALERLAAEHPRPARVVECRFFGGLSVEETAAALDVSPRTVKGDWSLARAWLYRSLSSG